MHGSPEQQIFDGLRRMIAARKSTAAFADYNNRELLDTENEHLFVFLRTNPRQNHDDVLVIANFNDNAQVFDLREIGNRLPLRHAQLRDVYSGESPDVDPGAGNGNITVPPFGFIWLTASAF